MQQNRYFRNLDWWLVIAIFGLIGIGICLIASATHSFAVTTGKAWHVERQSLFLAIDLALVIFSLRFDYRLLKDIATPLYDFNIILLFAVMFLGHSQLGAQRWIQIIENPILSNFKEGLSVLEYFISTHGARKGLADTALKTADAGYLTRRLVDVSHDVIVNEEDCGTLRGLVCTELKNNEEVIASLYERILGRVSVHDVIHPITGEVIVRSGEEIREDAAKAIQDSPIESVEIRSVLTCESKKGVCAKCYGRNLATNRMVQKGEFVTRRTKRDWLNTGDSFNG